MNEDERKCPRCAEIIKSEAKICRFCGYEFPLEAEFPRGESAASHQPVKTGGLLAAAAKTANLPPRALAFGALGAVLILLLAQVWSEQPAEQQKPAQGATTEKKAVQGRAAEPAQPTSPIVTYSKVERTAQAKKLMDDIGKGERPCDNAFGRATGRFSSMLDAYEYAKKAEAVCRENAAYIRSIPVPDYLSGDNKKQTNEGIDTIASAYSTKAYALEGIAAIYNGEAKPSFESEVKERVRLSSQELLEGTGKIIFAARDSGVDVANLSGGGKPSGRHHRHASGS